MIKSLITAIFAYQAGVIQPPPPPPPIYDPHPGPFIVYTDKRGAMLAGQEPIVRAALEAWHGPGLAAFLLCFREPEDRPGRGMAERSSLSNVARELKRHGAVAVVAGTSNICRSPGYQQAGQYYVEIMGVLSVD